MRPTTYQYAIGRIRALEPKLLTRDRMERMVDAKNAEEALKILSETEYGAKVSELPSPHDYELMLTKELKDVHDFIDTVTPDEELTDLFFIKHDIHNVKVLLKAKYLGMEEPEFLSTMGILAIDKLREALETDSDEDGNDSPYAELPDFLRVSLERLEKNDESGEKIDPQRIDVELDRAMYRYIFKVCKDKKQSFLDEYFKREVDLVNIRSLLRVKNIGGDFEFAKKVFMPYGDIGEDVLEDAFDRSLESLPESFFDTIYFSVVDRGVKSFLANHTFTEYERLSQDFLLDYVKAGQWELMGIQPIAGYILAKENEIEIIRIIMVGKVNNIPAAKIRERLRDTYV